MANFKYSLSKLKQLLTSSAAYAGLSAAKKNDIATHLKLNNVSLLQYIYYSLLEEQQVNRQNERELGEKILKISENKAFSLAKKLQTIK